MKESESEVLKIEESESELLCTDPTALSTSLNYFTKMCITDCNVKVLVLSGNRRSTRVARDSTPRHTDV
jgi:hypothetical protein